MKTQIILLALFSISFAAVTSSSPCACEEITFKDDCVNGCAWVTVGSDSSCQAMKATVDCAAQKEETPCNDQNACVWKSGACATFSACSDMTTTAAGVCSKKSPLCTDGAVGSACVNIKCSSLTQDKCTGAIESEKSICKLNGTTCAAVDVSKCSVITDSALCSQQECNWKSDKCQAFTCADLTKDDCDYVYNDDQTQITLCSFGTACAEAADASGLQSGTCKKQTGNYFAWDGSACSACEGSASYSYLLGFIGILAMLLI